MAQAGNAPGGARAEEPPDGPHRRGSWHHTAPRRVAHLAVQYARLRYIGRYLTFVDHLRSLPRAEARVAVAALGVAAVLVAAMPALLWLGVRMPGVAFRTVDGGPAVVPSAGLLLTLAGFAAGWAFALAGAAQGPGLLWVVLSGAYVYFVVFVGIAAGPTYVQWIGLLLPVAVGALTPETRWWGQYVLIALVASLMVRTPPFATTVQGMSWPVVWLPFVAVLVVGHHVVGRRPWSAAGRVGLAAAGLCLYLALIARRTEAGELATALSVSFNGTFEILSLLWFVLGAAFVGGGFALAKLVREGLETLAPDRALPWVVGAGWLTLVGWVVAQSPGGAAFPLREASLAALLALLVMLAVVARRRRLSRDWLAGWFVASLAAVLVLRAYATHGIRSVVEAQATLETKAAAVSVAGFLYAIAWEVGGEIGHVPLSTPRLARPSPLLLYLAGVLLISAAALFGTAARLVRFQSHIILNEYQGAAALSIPLAALAAARTWPTLRPEALGRAVAAFYWGTVLAVPAFLLRASVPGPISAAVVVAAPAVLGLLLVVRWPDTRALLPAAAVGCAAGLGFVVSLTQRVLVGVLQDALWIAAAVTKNAFASRAGAANVRRLLELEGLWTSRDERLTTVLIVLFSIAAASAVAIWFGRCAARGLPREATVPAGRP